jgi:hypothetical protein
MRAFLSQVSHALFLHRRRGLHISPAAVGFMSLYAIWPQAESEREPRDRQQ